MGNGRPSAHLMPKPLRGEQSHIDSGEQSRCKEQNKVSDTLLLPHGIKAGKWTLVAGLWLQSWHQALRIAAARCHEEVYHENFEAARGRVVKDGRITFTSTRPSLFSSLFGGIAAALLMTISLWSASEAKVPLSEGESTTRYRELQQKLVDLKVLEDDMQATLDRAKADRDDASWEMVKAKMALAAKMYREAGLWFCELYKKTAYGKLCVEGNKLLETTQALGECRNGDASGCEKLKGKLNGYGAQGFKKWAPGMEADMAELAVDLDQLKSQFKRGDKKAVAASACAISAKLSNWGGPEDLTEKMELACKTGETVATLYEDGKAFLGLFTEAKRLDQVIQSNLSQMQAKFDAVKASRQALESRLSALVVAEKEEATDSDKNCDLGPVVNPELARAEPQTGVGCKPKTTKQDQVCDETLGCPEDESDTSGKDKELLAKLDADLERIRNSSSDTAAGTLPGSTLEASQGGSSFDTLAALRSLRSGLGVYRQGREAFSSSGGSSGISSGGNCANTIPYPPEAIAIVQRRGHQLPPMPTVDAMIQQAGGADSAASALRQQIQSQEQALAQWPAGREEEVRRLTELTVGHNRQILQAVECRRGASQQPATPPGSVNRSRQESSRKEELHLPLSCVRPDGRRGQRIYNERTRSYGACNACGGGADGC